MAEGGIAVRNFSTIVPRFCNFPQFSAILGAIAIFAMGIFDTAIFLEGVQKHNMRFEIHNLCLEHPFLSKFMKVDHNM